MGQIILNGMEFHSYIGHFDEEKKVGNPFVVDLKIKVNCEPAAVSDDLKDALDYQIVYSIVKEEMKKKCNLIENVAKRIVESLFNEFDILNKIKIKVSKLNPSLGGKIQNVSVVLKKKKN